MLDTVLGKPGTPVKLVFFIGNKVTDAQRRHVRRDLDLVGHIFAAVVMFGVFIGGCAMIRQGIVGGVMRDDVAGGMVFAGLGCMVLAFGVTFFIWSLVLIRRVIAGRNWTPTEDSARYVHDNARPLKRLREQLGDEAWKRVTSEIFRKTDLGGALDYEVMCLVDDTYVTFINPPHSNLPSEEESDDLLNGMVTRTVASINNLFNRERARQHRRTEEKHTVQIARQDGNALMSERLLAQFAADTESPVPTTT